MWASFIVKSPSYWKGSIRKILGHPSSVHQSIAGLFLPGKVISSGPGGMAVSHQCSVCQELFITKDRLGTHQFKVHGIKNECRLYAYSTYCLCCEVEFWSRERHIYHLRRSTRCRHAVMGNVIPMSVDEANRLDSQAAQEQRDNVRGGRSPRYVVKPAVPRSGPLPAWATVCA